MLCNHVSQNRESTSYKVIKLKLHINATVFMHFILLLDEYSFFLYFLSNYLLSSIIKICDYSGGMNDDDVLELRNIINSTKRH